MSQAPSTTETGTSDAPEEELFYTLWTVFKRDSDLDRSEGVEAFDGQVGS